MLSLFLKFRTLQSIPLTLLAFLLLSIGQVEAQGEADSKLLLTYESSAQQSAPNTTKQQSALPTGVVPAEFKTAPADKNEPTPPVAVAQPEFDPRQLAPPSSKKLGLGANVLSAERPPNRLRDTAKFSIPQFESLSTAGTGLAIVVGLFLLCIILMRRSGPTPTTPLPKEAVAVLGRVPLAARTFAHLIQIGNKLVLVSMTPEGATPITEVTDPGEVERLLGICHRKHKHSSTAEFHNVLQQLANEPTKGFLGNEAHAMSAGHRR